MARARGTQERPTIVGIETGVGPLEAQVVRAMGEVGRSTSVREVCDRISKDGYFAYQGVLNCMNRLTSKGILARTEKPGAYEYRLLVDLEELAAQVVMNVYGHMGGDLNRVVCRLLGIDPEQGVPELAKLCARLQAPSGKADGLSRKAKGKR